MFRPKYLQTQLINQSITQFNPIPSVYVSIKTYLLLLLSSYRTQSTMKNKKK